MKDKVLENQIALWDSDRNTKPFFDGSAEKHAFKPYNKGQASGTPSKKPKKLVLDKGHYWCPYCKSRVRFVKDRYLGIRRCPLCGISENDYHVKLENKKRP